jgi:hypothetical protein
MTSWELASLELKLLVLTSLELELQVPVLLEL